MNLLIFLVFLALILPYEGFSSKNLRKSLLKINVPKYSKRYIWDHGKLRKIQHKKLKSREEKNKPDFAIRKLSDEEDKPENRGFWARGEYYDSMESYGGGDYGSVYGSQRYGGDDYSAGSYGDSYSSGDYGGGDYGRSDYGSYGGYGGGGYGGGSYSPGSYGGDFGGGNGGGFGSDYGGGFGGGYGGGYGGGNGVGFINAQGGDELKAEQVLFMVSILHGQKLRCTGIILKTDWIVTAGWCVTGISHTELQVRVGSVKHATGGCVHVVKTVAVPEMYRHFTPEDHNIGLIKISPPIEIGGNVKEATLSPNEMEANKEYTVSGWGPRQNPVDTLKHAKVKLMNFDECKAHNKEKEWGKFITKTHSCTAPGLCEGDIGAALHDGTLVFGLGIRGSDDCSKLNNPSVFSKFGGTYEKGRGGLKGWIDATIKNYTEF